MPQQTARGVSPDRSIADGGFLARNATLGVGGRVFFFDAAALGAGIVERSCINSPFVDAVQGNAIGNDAEKQHQCRQRHVIELRQPCSIGHSVVRQAVLVSTPGSQLDDIRRRAWPEEPGAAPEGLAGKAGLQSQHAIAPV
jgi:hypothetical protein